MQLGHQFLLPEKSVIIFCNIRDESIFWLSFWITNFCILAKLSAQLHLVNSSSPAKTSWEIFYKSVNKKKWRQIRLASFAVLIEGQLDSSYTFAWISDVRIRGNMRALNLAQRRCWNLNSSGMWLCVSLLLHRAFCIFTEYYTPTNAQIVYYILV